jgi:hypothetical protein
MQRNVWQRIKNSQASFVHAASTARTSCATDRLLTTFVGFLLSSNKCSNGSQVTCCYGYFSRKSQHLHSPLAADTIKLLVFPNYLPEYKNSAKATTITTPHVFPFTLLLPEGRTDEGWEPLTKWCCSSPKNKVSLTSLPEFFSAPTHLPSLLTLIFIN